MRDPERIELLLDLIKRVWLLSPDLRLGQLIENAIDSYDKSAGTNTHVFYVEDDVLYIALTMHAIDSQNS